MGKDPDAIIIGAGMAGLAAACELGRAGLAVCILEARDRLGGRVFTEHDPACDAPIELGAEFIHGKPCEIFDLLDDAGTKISEVDGDNWCVWDGRLSSCDLFSDVDAILEKMDDSLPDESFLQFLQRRFACPKTDQQKQVQAHAISYVSGFNAADPSLVGVHWLVQGMRAEEKIQGDRVFRSLNGYEDLLRILRRKIEGYGLDVRTGAVVEKVSWRPIGATVTYRSTRGLKTFEIPHVLITIPLPLLKVRVGSPGVIEFVPDLPAEKTNALEKLEMGKVIRVTLCFRERFWDQIKPSPQSKKKLSNMAFLFSQDEWFPTWWTTMPKKSPVITGWAPFRCAERLSGQSRSFVVEHAMRTLSNLLGPSFHELESLLQSAYFHDWQADPFSQGAYSYGKIGADGAQAALAKPLGNTLFFAGEATDLSGRNETVHGAIASGYRAAQQILRSRMQLA